MPGSQIILSILLVIDYAYLQAGSPPKLTYSEQMFFITITSSSIRRRTSELSLLKITYRKRKGLERMNSRSILSIPLLL